MSCVFCAIAKKDIPSQAVLETDHVICIFPREPEVVGHTLIITRDHFDDIRKCPAEIGGHVFEAAQRLAAAYEISMGATGFNLLNANGPSAEQSIQHLHFHFLPRLENDGFSAWPQFPPLNSKSDYLMRRVKLALS